MYGSAPGRMLAATSSPTASAASGVESVAKQMSLAATASCTLAATAAPASRSGSQRSRVRFHTVTSYPALTRLRAWPGQARPLLRKLISPPGAANARECG